MKLLLAIYDLQKNDTLHYIVSLNLLTA